jgi:hypothetical protein
LAKRNDLIIVVTKPAIKQNKIIFQSFNINKEIIPIAIKCKKNLKILPPIKQLIKFIPGILYIFALNQIIVKTTPEIKLHKNNSRKEFFPLNIKINTTINCMICGKYKPLFIMLLKLKYLLSSKLQ